MAYVDGLPQPNRSLVMGVVNVTPDSFSDGGLWFDASSAVDHGLRLAAQGADLVDVGGESTRPGAKRPPLEEELRRVVPVVREVAAAGVTVSVDTMRSEVAQQALEAGAHLVNDVSGGLADPDILRVVADADVPIVLMHWRGHSDHMQELAVYDDVVTDVMTELQPRIDAAISAGIAEQRIIIDPGLGFAKTWDHNWTVLARLVEIVNSGFPVLVAASRKTFLGELLADPHTGERREPHQRDAASTALTTTMALDGVWAVRVHEVPANVDAVRVAARLGWERSSVREGT
ncbi:dihydropteroate synthase [Actinobacteria bacterium YIM 96077]|uniref:Dihydropteroate synthase n=1 Tax=Phytoactinopolyspora halophila TaxID=1981511 RepID=A0A329R0H8_9ACTN|nr:dihydropteroate synthase [Actinobacteria bacterium YIM 96077]RAW18124.1 dihydropteroate synthase [Phytoactinopolyspora halophila]